MVLSRNIVSFQQTGGAPASGDRRRIVLLAIVDSLWAFAGAECSGSAAARRPIFRPRGSPLASTSAATPSPA